MALKLYNTLTRSLDDFVPRDEKMVTVYACGPTIYDHAHIGNFRSFIVYDLLHRYLEWRGYSVRFAMNLTDVDDKTIERAVEEGVSISEVTEPFGRAVFEGLDALGILEADVYPKATEHVPDMVDFVGRLVEGGHAYVADDGSVYFSIESFPTYGRLSRVDLDQVKPGARVAMDEYAKEDVRDFALWKTAKPEDEAVGAAWDSPWGRGRPGWHIECSVMSIAQLGETLDLHLGGEDLIFPHHEDEIAQSEAATGKPFVRNWLHVKHLQVEGRKMAKSLGNYTLLKDLLAEGYEPSAIRHLLVSAHYRAELNFTRDGLEACGRAVQRLIDFERRLEETATSDDAPESPIAVVAREAVEHFQRALDADLNSAEALAALFVLVSKVNALLDAGSSVRPAERDAALDALRSMDRVFGLLELARKGRAVDADTEASIEFLIEEREQARASRDFQRADEIREELAEQGIALEDTAGGTRWKVVKGTA